MPGSQHLGQRKRRRTGRIPFSPALLLLPCHTGSVPGEVGERKVRLLPVTVAQYDRRQATAFRATLAGEGEGEMAEEDTKVYTVVLEGIIESVKRGSGGSVATMDEMNQAMAAVSVFLCRAARVVSGGGPNGKAAMLNAVGAIWDLDASDDPSLESRAMIRLTSKDGGSA